MGVTTEQPPAPSIAQVFDEGAACYARHWAPALNGHARDLVAVMPEAPDGQPRTVLDVAAGAGTLLPALTPIAGRGGRVVALDRSAGMLALADPALPRLQADAAQLPFADACTDVAVYAFVLFLLPDAKAAVVEAARVIRPGGWLLAATWGTQVGTAADVVVREELDTAGAPPFPAFPRSDELTDSPDRMRTLLEGSGFTDVSTTGRPHDAPFEPATAHAMRPGTRAQGWRWARLSQQSRSGVVERAAARLAELPPEDFVDRSEVLLTTARRS